MPLHIAFYALRIRVSVNHGVVVLIRHISTRFCIVCASSLMIPYTGVCVVCVHVYVCVCVYGVQYQSCVGSGSSLHHINQLKDRLFLMGWR